MVSGRVQGVGFRYSTAREADRLGLTGWVRNAPGGVVEVFAQGTASAIDAMIEFLRIGPRYADVSSVEVTDVAPEPERVRFDVTP